MVWFIEKNGEAKKIPEEVLKYKIENNEISGDNLAVNEEIKNWVPLRETQLWKETVKDLPEQNRPEPGAGFKATHTWRCEKCGNMISETPCKYCSGQIPEQSDSHIVSENIPPKKDQRQGSKKFIGLLVLVALVVIIGIFSKTLFSPKLEGIYMTDRFYLSYNAITFTRDGKFVRNSMTDGTWEEVARGTYKLNGTELVLITDGGKSWTFYYDKDADEIYQYSSVLGTSTYIHVQ